MAKGVVPIFLAAPNVTPFAFSILTPPVPAQVAGNSGPVICAILPLY
jgi:hypothetical protein